MPVKRKSALLIFNSDNKLLNVRTHPMVAAGKDLWFLPGGKPEGHESLEDALLRECGEELAIEVDRQSLRPYGEFDGQIDDQPPGHRVHITCYMGAYTGTPQPRNEVAELAWFGHHEGVRTTEASRKLFAQLRNDRLLAD